MRLILYQNWIGTLLEIVSGNKEVIYTVMNKGDLDSFVELRLRFWSL